jgi:hypothetical protein
MRKEHRHRAHEPADHDQTVTSVIDMDAVEKAPQGRAFSLLNNDRKFRSGHESIHLGARGGEPNDLGAKDSSARCLSLERHPPTARLF